MGFLNWFQSNESAEDSTQLDLLEDNQQLSKRRRVDGAIVNRDFRDAIHGSGGSQKAYPKAVIAETKELFGCELDELYQSTGGKKGNRGTLPEAAQKAYMASEIRATHELGRTEFYDCENPDQVDRKIISTTRAAAKETRKWLPW